MSDYDSPVDEKNVYTKDDGTREEYEVDRLKAGTDDDRHDMSRMGKMQQFKRNFSFLPIFGFAATLMVTWEAVLTSTSYILSNGGLPAMIWMYVISVFGFGCAILSMAEMASMAPTSGGQYHWVSEFAPKSSQKILSYIIGWLCVLGWQAGVAGQNFTVALQVQGLIALNKADYIPKPWHTVLLTVAAVSATVCFNTFFAKKLPLLEGIVLVVHIVGFFAVLITLWVTAPQTPTHDVWINFEQTSGWPSMGLAALVGLSSPVISLIGPDSAVHMSEEIRDASRVLPWAMVSTLLLNGITGFIMAVTFAYCIGPIDTAIQPPYFFAFISTFYNATQSHAGATFMSCIMIFMTFCSGIANVATSSRQMFAFARDRGLPFAPWLSHVYSGWDLPLNSVLVTSIITVLLSLINLGSDVTFNAILSIGVVALLSSYLVSISCILIKRIRGERLLPRRWNLGKWGMPLNIIGLAFTAVAYVFAFFPLAPNPTAETMNWACVVYAGVVIAATVYHLAYARKTYVPPVARLAKDL